MIQTIIAGIGLGLGLAVLLGPAFFTLIQTSIDRGFKCAIRLAFGIFFSDVFLVAIMFLGATSFLKSQWVNTVIGLVGGGVLIGFGVYTFLSRGKGLNRKEIVDPEIHVKAPKQIIYFLKGFFLNLANPATWLFWLLWVGLVTTQYTDENGVKVLSLIVFFSATLLTVLATDILKSFLAHQLKNKINDVMMSKLNMIFGLILIGFGIYLVVNTLIPIIQKITM